MNKLKAIGVVLGVAAFVSACSEAPEPEVKEIVRPAKLFEVEAADNTEEFRFPAVVEAINSKDLTFLEQGQLLELNVREGDVVTKGQVIARLDTRVYQNQLDSARTQYNTAKIEFERAERLRAADAIAQSIYDQRENALTLAKSQLDNAEKAFEDTVLRAPYDAIVADTYVDELQAVGPQNPVLTIQTSGEAEAKVKVPARLVSRMKQIKPVETKVILDSHADTPLDAKMVGVIALADERSQTFDMSFSFLPTEEMTVLPGMTGIVSAKLAFTDETAGLGRMLAPASAVLSDAKGQFVWVYNEQNNTVNRKNVDVGDISNDMLTIRSGVQAGDLIVAAGGTFMQEGMKIRPLED